MFKKFEFSIEGYQIAPIAIHTGNNLTIDFNIKQAVLAAYFFLWWHP